MDIFSNRELASIFWITVLTGYVLFSSHKGVAGIRIALKRAFVIFFTRSIQSILAVMMVYIGCTVYFLHEINLWDLSQLKATIIWAGSFGVMSLFKIESIKKNRNFFRHSILDSLKILALIEFVISSYSAHIIIEIIIMLIMTIVTVLLAYTKGKAEFSKLTKYLNNVVWFFVLTVIAFTIYMLVKNFDEFAREQTIYAFVTPILLTLCFLPFLFLTMVYMTYQSVNIRLRCVIKDPSHRRFAKFLALVVFNVRIELLERWVSILIVSDIGSYKDIWHSLKKLSHMRALERNPIIVAASEGWSPYKAKDFLVDHELETGYYYDYDGQWHANSDPLGIGHNFSCSTISYIVEGCEAMARKLKLKVRVIDETDAAIANDKMMEVVKALYQKATGSLLPERVQSAISKEKEFQEQIGHYKLAFENRPWANSKTGAYDMKFSIAI